MLQNRASPSATASTFLPQIYCTDLGIVENSAVGGSFVRFNRRENRLSIAIFKRNEIVRIGALTIARLCREQQNCLPSQPQRIARFCCTQLKPHLLNRHLWHSSLCIFLEIFGWIIVSDLARCFLGAYVVPFLQVLYSWLCNSGRVALIIEAQNAHPKSRNTPKNGTFTRTVLITSHEFFSAFLRHESGTQQKLFRKNCSD